MCISKEKRLNREVELKTIKRIGSEYRRVYYTLKTNNPIKRFFAKKGILLRAYYCSPGLTDLFSPDEFKEAFREIKTYADLERWEKRQREIDKERRDELEREWQVYDE